MPLFHRRVDNTAAVAAPPPAQDIEAGPVIHHHYAPNRVGTLFSLFVITLTSLVLIWFGLIYLAEQMGYARPEQAVIQCLIGLAILTGAMLLAAGLVRFVLTDYWAHRQIMAQKYIELEQVRARLSAAIPPVAQTRMTREESRQYQAVKIVMERAYQMADPGGRLRTKTQPWSRREVGRLKLFNETEPIGENSKLAGWVAPYLLDKRILTSDRQINLTDFPTLAAVESQLISDFGPPIIYHAGGGGMSTHYLEKGSSRESWG